MCQNEDRWESAGRGCAACIAVFFDSSKAEGGMAWPFDGHIPVFQKAD